MRVICPPGAHSYLWIGGQHAEVVGFDIGTELKTLTGHTDYIKAIAITWDGPAGYGRDVTIALWMLER